MEPPISAHESKCRPGEHNHLPLGRRDSNPAALERASRLFRALGDGPRLRLLQLMTAGERCVSELVEATAEKFSTVSQRLRLLRAEGLVVRRREGAHFYYALADRHVVDLMNNALAHAEELEVGPRGPARSTEGPGEEEA
jgi:ArsR family transcriptional regulator